ncbi:hypothetical protein BH09MYX1_BH09MYX1_12330 [soil metagenome]
MRLDAERGRRSQKQRPLLRRDVPIDDRRFDEECHDPHLNVGGERAESRRRVAGRVRDDAVGATVLGDTEALDDALQELTLLVRNDAIGADDGFDQQGDLFALFDIHPTTLPDPDVLLAFAAHFRFAGNMFASYADQLRARAEAISSICVHAGDEPDATSRALEPPLVLSSAYAFADAEHAAGAFRGDNDAFIYGRWKNPTVEQLEAKLAALEGTESACATASGMAAVSGAILALCDSGAHIVAPRSMYAESARLLRERLPRFGITTTFVDGTDPAAYDAAITDRTRVLYIETPSNPNLRLTDIRAVVAIARGQTDVVTLADNTFATPFAQTPHALGVDLVIHSLTKGLGGHGDAIGGVVCGTKALVGRVRDFSVKGLGGVLAPFNALLVSRGLRTFALRLEQSNRTAAKLAQVLAETDGVARVHHPSRADHPGHALARAQMHAFGALLSFELEASASASAIDRGRRVLEGVRLVTHAVSLGDARSLLSHPASTTHSTMPKADREAAGITDGLLRLSVGLESESDLASDLVRAIRSA